MLFIYDRDFYSSSDDEVDVNEDADGNISKKKGYSILCIIILSVTLHSPVFFTWIYHTYVILLL